MKILRRPSGGAVASPRRILSRLARSIKTYLAFNETFGLTPFPPTAWIPPTQAPMCRGEGPRRGAKGLRSGELASGLGAEDDDNNSVSALGAVTQLPIQTISP